MFDLMYLFMCVCGHTLVCTGDLYICGCDLMPCSDAWRPAENVKCPVLSLTTLDSFETGSLIGSEPCGLCQAGSQRVPRIHLSPPHDNGGSAWPCLLVWCWKSILMAESSSSTEDHSRPLGLLISCSGFSLHVLVIRE